MSGRLTVPGAVCPAAAGLFVCCGRLPPATRLFVGHDYPPPTREPRGESSVAEERAHNIHVRDGVTQDDFFAMRTARDATLEVPTRMLPSLPINVRAGELPPADADGMRYLRLPLNRL